MSYTRLMFFEPSHDNAKQLDLGVQRIVGTFLQPSLQ
jgi:hypothetical protein